jgi:hypothetical protein
MVMAYDANELNDLIVGPALERVREKLNPNERTSREAYETALRRELEILIAEKSVSVSELTALVADLVMIILLTSLDQEVVDHRLSDRKLN